jgi:hypothetical protein
MFELLCWGRAFQPLAQPTGEGRSPNRYPFLGGFRFLVALPFAPDLSVSARDLFLGAMRFRVRHDAVAEFVSVRGRGQRRCTTPGRAVLDGSASPGQLTCRVDSLAQQMLSVFGLKSTERSSFQMAAAVRISLGVFPVQRLYACVNALTSLKPSSHAIFDTCRLRSWR